MFDCEATWRTTALTTVSPNLCISAASFYGAGILCIACVSIWKTEFWFHWWELQWQKPDDSGWFRAQLVDISGTADWLLGKKLQLYSPPSAIVEEPLQRAWLRPRVVRCPARPIPSTLGPHLKLSGWPFHGMVPATLLGSRLKIEHQFITRACQEGLCCIGTSLNFGNCYRVTHRGCSQLQ